MSAIQANEIDGNVPGLRLMETIHARYHKTHLGDHLMGARRDDSDIDTWHGIRRRPTHLDLASPRTGTPYDVRPRR